MAKIVLFNKPYGVLSQFRSEAGQATLAQYISIPAVYPAGRLDKESEGLLLLTDDGQLQHQISDPRHKAEKVYWVQVEGIPSEQALQQLQAGVMLKDGMTRPARVKRLDEPSLWPRDPPVRYRANIPTSWLELVISEGRNRQVRRMTAAVGYPTLRLIRYQIGNWTLQDIPPGEWKVIEVADTMPSSQAKQPGKKPHAGKPSRHRRRPY